MDSAGCRARLIAYPVSLEKSDTVVSISLGVTNSPSSAGDSETVRISMTVGTPSAMRTLKPRAKSSYKC